MNRKFFGLFAVLLLILSVTPAYAGHRRRPPQHRHHHRHPRTHYWDYGPRCYPNGYCFSYRPFCPTYGFGYYTPRMSFWYGY